MFGVKRSLWLVPGFVLSIACGGGGDEGSEDVSDESDGAETEGGETGDAEGTDGFEPGGCSQACGAENCGECPSAAVVAGEGFAIDAVEVTNGQYAAMLAIDFDTSVLPGGCEWKQGFLPAEWSDSLDPALPVVGVDWCDAMVYCAWAGKELCGAVGGGPTDWANGMDAMGDAWYRACSSDGTQDYPYGDAFDAQACNGSEALIDQMVVGGSIASCEGSLTGLFDMSGNVWEWTNACESQTGDGATLCRRRGGSFHSEADALRCGVKSERERAERDDAVGFRCCSPG
ncbi:formylglycine-generating enzyme family protein [Nannocystaceae bacterium ST9]